MRWLILLLCVFSCRLFAHEVQPAVLQLTQAGNGVDWKVLFKQPFRSSRTRSAAASLAPFNLAVITNCVASSGRQRTSGVMLEQRFNLKCMDEPLSVMSINGIEQTLVDVIVTVKDRQAATTRYLLNARKPSVEFSSGTAIPIFLLLGIEHLLLGFDHVLFLLVLLYLVPGWKNLLGVITAFTVAHSLTLGLSVFQLITLPQPPVEALVALSIVVLAREALSSRRSLISARPWLAALAFGLLHGLGFAGALSAIGLPEDNAVGALFLFNVGIELGQLMIVSLALTLVVVGARLGLKMTWHSSQPMALMQAPLYLAGGISTYWFVERCVQIAG